MAVIYFKELMREQGGSFDARSRARRYKRGFTVRTDDALDGPQVVQSYFLMPALYSTYTSGNDVDSGAIVENVEPERLGPKLWKAIVSYSTATPDSDQNAENPTDRAPRVRWGTASYQVPVTLDADNKRIVNSANDPFDPPIEREEKRVTLHYQRFEAIYSPDLSVLYQYAVNSDVFIGQAAGYCRCNSIQAERHYEKGVYCWDVSYEFEFRREGYWARPLDQGFRYLDASKVPQTIRDQGVPISAPVMLNGAGKPLSLAKTTLAVAMDAAIPIATVASVTNFLGATTPAAEYVIEIDDEQMLVTFTNTISPVGFTVTRGYAGTTAAAHSVSAIVRQMPVYREFRIHRHLPFAALNITL